MKYLQLQQEEAHRKWVNIVSIKKIRSANQTCSRNIIEGQHSFHQISIVTTQMTNGKEIQIYREKKPFK